MGLGRLRGDRNHPADRGRDPVRGGRSRRGRARARRGLRQRQRHPGGGAPLVPGDRPRLRAGAAAPAPASGPGPSGWRSSSSRATPSSLPFADAHFDVALSTFGIMFAPDQEQAAREIAAGGQAGRQDRPGQLDAGGVHRPAAQDGRQTRARRRPAWPRPSTGAPRPACASCSADAARCPWPSARTSRSATGRRRTSSTSSGASTARPTRPSAPWTPPGRPGWPPTSTELLARFNRSQTSCVVPAEYLEVVIDR